MVVGFLWYGTWAFGRSWMQLSGRAMGEGQQTGPLYALTAVGMQKRGEKLDPVDETGTGPAEVRRTVDAEDARARDPCQRLGLSGGALRVPAAWHRDDDLWSCGHDLVVRDFARTLARTPKD